MELKKIQAFQLGEYAHALHIGETTYQKNMEALWRSVGLDCPLTDQPVQAYVYMNALKAFNRELFRCYVLGFFSADMAGYVRRDTQPEEYYCAEQLRQAFPQEDSSLAAALILMQFPAARHRNEFEIVKILNDIDTMLLAYAAFQAEAEAAEEERIRTTPKKAYVYSKMSEPEAPRRYNFARIITAQLGICRSPAPEADAAGEI